MKNKILNILCVFSCFLSITSCSNKQKIVIEKNDNTISDLDYETLKEKLFFIDCANEKHSGDSFILYGYTNGCSSCARIETNVIQKYKLEGSFKIYKVEDNIITENNNFGLKNIVYPSIFIFDNGDLFTYSNNEKIFENLDTFSNYLNKYCTVTNIIKLNTIEELDETIKTNCVVYFGWSKCSDCDYYEKYCSYKFINYNDYYYFDVDEFRKNKDTNPETWNNFIDKYGLNINENGGKVPTFIYYENSTITDYAIFFNDELEFVNNKYKIIKTSYGTNELSNMTFSTYLEYQQKTQVYHETKLKAFMNKYLLK